MSATQDLLRANRVNLWQELNRLRLPLDSDLFLRIVAEWPEWMKSELRAIIKARFGDEGISRPSILEAIGKLRSWPLDSITRPALIRLGNVDLCSGDDEALKSSLAEVRRHYFFLMAASPDLGFQCLHELSADDGASLIRGLAIAEECGYSRAGGSVSMVNWAFPVFQSHPLPIWAELADWIIANTSNDYIPFNFRRTRYQWEACCVGSPSPSETWHRVNQTENARGREKTERFNREQQEANERAKAKAERIAAIRKEHESNRQEHEHRRSRFLNDLKGLTPLERFRRICEEPDFPLDAIPAEYAALLNDDVLAMPLDLRNSLVTRLKDRRKGPWRELFVRLSAENPKEEDSHS
jgi:hypothetical protein